MEGRGRQKTAGKPDANFEEAGGRGGELMTMMTTTAHL